MWVIDAYRTLAMAHKSNPSIIMRTALIAYLEANKGELPKELIERMDFYNKENDYDFAIMEAKTELRKVGLVKRQRQLLEQLRRQGVSKEKMREWIEKSRKLAVMQGEEKAFKKMLKEVFTGSMAKEVL